MTRHARAASVVIIALLAASVPALASGHATARSAAGAGAAIACPLVGATGSAGTAKPLAKHSKPHRRHRRTRRHRMLAGATHSVIAHATTTCSPLCIGVCAPVHCVLPQTGAIAEPRGATLVCVPVPCGASSGVAASPAGATLVCLPLPCVSNPPTGASGSTGATAICGPIHCVTTGSAPSGATTSCGPITCASTEAGGTAGTEPPVTGDADCPPLPSCPPLPQPNGPLPQPTVYACPVVSASTARTG